MIVLEYYLQCGVRLEFYSVVSMLECGLCDTWNVVPDTVSVVSVIL